MIPQIPHLPKEKRQKIKDNFASWNEQGEPEGTLFNISYKYYLEKECGINNFVSGSYKAFTKYLKDIGKSANLSDLKTCFGHKLKRVENKGEYKKIYNKLSDDEEVFEINLSTTNRLFFFIVENFFYIRALRAKHFETNKNRK